jgi:uncharacterized membrane protein
MENTSGISLSGDGKVSDFSRITSVLAGTVLLMKVFNGKKAVVKGISGGYLLYRGITGHCPLTQQLKADQDDASIIQVSITVNKPREVAYSFWRKLSNLPLFMKHLASVQEVSGSISKWSAVIPGHLGTIDWETEITGEKENELLRWRSVENSDVDNSGIITFADAGKFGTELRVTISYKAPAGKVGVLVAKLLNPVFTGMVKEDVRNFKRYIETGEIPTTEGQPAGK